MFIIDATVDYAQACARLARLMYNIERGARVFEWGPGSPTTTNPQPKPGFLTISVPGVTKNSPPSIVSLRPSVAFIYYVPGIDLRHVVDQLRCSIEQFPDDHLRGYLPVEATSHATLFHRNRIHNRCLSTTTKRAPYHRGWSPDERYPARHFHIENTGNAEIPSHVSYRAAFTWYFRPISTIVQTSTLTTFEEFNAVVSAVFFDTLLGGKEVAEPIYDITADFFSVHPAPEDIRKALALYGHALIHCDRGFVLARSKILKYLDNWAPPGSEGFIAKPGELDIANITPGPVGDNQCAICQLPLWGDIFAIGDDMIAPFHVAVCSWCAGCLPRRQRARAIHIKFPRTVAEAYEGTPFAALLPLLEADVEAIPVGDSCVFLVSPRGAENGTQYFVEPADENSPKTTPPCLRFPELRNYRYSSIVCTRLSRVCGNGR